VAEIGREEARAVIRRFEWLGSTGCARIFYGLRDREGELLAVCRFGHGAHGASRGGALVLERGCTLPHAPPHAASHLIGRALRALRKAGWRAFKAFSDPMAGETGGLYRALGWRPGVNRHGKWRYALVERGKVRSDRAIYRRYGSHAAAREPGAIHRAAACQGRLGMASAMNLAHDFSGYSAVYTVTVPSAAQSASSLPTMLLARMLIIEPSGEKGIRPEFHREWPLCHGGYMRCESSIFTLSGPIAAV
jgi:hypothetical protein